MRTTPGGAVVVPDDESREPSAAAVRAPLIEMVGVEKIYRTGRLEYAALRGIDLAVAEGELNVLLALGGTLALALLVIVGPIQRAVRFRPGEGLRYL